MRRVQRFEIVADDVDRAECPERPWTAAAACVDDEGRSGDFFAAGAGATLADALIDLAEAVRVSDEEIR